MDFILILPTGVRIIRRALCQREELSFLTEVGHLGQDVNNFSAGWWPTSSEYACLAPRWTI